MAAGVAIALPATADSQAPAKTLRAGRGRLRKAYQPYRNNIAPPPESSTVIKPSTMPIMPDVSSTEKLMPAPIAKAANGIISFSPGARNSRTKRLLLPKIKPKIIGKIAANKATSGKSAKPAVPSATMVKNGPSLSDNTEIAPRSVLLPNWPVSATYREPLELDIAAIIASGNSPQSVPSGIKKATPKPTATAIKYLPSSKTNPFSTAGKAALSWICAPMHIKNKPINTGTPFLNKAVVKLPIFKMAGANVLMSAPKNSGKIISAPGILPSLYKRLSISPLLVVSLLFQAAHTPKRRQTHLPCLIWNKYAVILIKYAFACLSASAPSARLNEAV